MGVNRRMGNSEGRGGGRSRFDPSGRSPGFRTAFSPPPRCRFGGNGVFCKPGWLPQPPRRTSQPIQKMITSAQTWLTYAAHRFPYRA